MKHNRPPPPPPRNHHVAPGRLPGFSLKCPKPDGEGKAVQKVSTRCLSRITGPLTVNACSKYPGSCVGLLAEWFGRHEPQTQLPSSYIGRGVRRCVKMREDKCANEQGFVSCGLS